MECSEIFSKFIEAHEAIKRRAHDITHEINGYAMRNRELLEEHDQAFLADNSKRVAEIQEQCAELDKKILWAQRQQDLLNSPAGIKQNGQLIELAQKWEATAKKEVAALAKEWKAAEDALEQAQTAMLACVAKLGAIANRANKIRGQANGMAQSGHAPGFIVLPNDHTDPKRGRGTPWAVGADLITSVYKKGKMEG